MFNESQVTVKGLALIAKVLAGRTKFNFDTIQAGDGHFNGTVKELTELVSPRLTGKIVRVREMGSFTELSCVITNQHLTNFMEFREIGIRVDDPDEGSILFAYANAGEFASPIGPFNGVWVHEERFTIRVFTANATNITATIEATGYASEMEFINDGTGLVSENVQDAIEEVAEMLTTHINESVYTSEPHNIRFNAETGTLEINNGDGWFDVASGNRIGRLGVARFGSARFGAM